MECLTIEKLEMQFKGVKAVHNVSMKLEQGKLYALIGTNGAGKTTIINMISGVLKPTSGTISFLDRILRGCGRIGLRGWGLPEPIRISGCLRR